MTPINQKITLIMTSASPLLLLISTSFVYATTWSNVGGIPRFSSSKRRRTTTTTTTTTTPTDMHRCCFVPCAAPRFDAFAEQLVGTWKAAESSPPPALQKEVPVEEVMRSCGGAVQGIREGAIILLSSSMMDDNDRDGDEAKSGLYLNRANDGFVFFDSGSYSFGPTSISTAGSSSPSPAEETVGDMQVANFMLGKTTRLIVLTSLLKDRQSTKDYVFLRKTFGGADNTTPAAPRTIQWIAGSPPEVEVFSSTIQCSMPSPGGQPWNLQRAKWSKSFVQKDADEEYDTNVVESSTIGEDLCCWASAHPEPASAFADWSGFSKFGGGYDPQHGSVLQVGVLCQSTGFVQSMARIYSATGELSNVLYLQGRVRP